MGRWRNKGHHEEAMETAKDLLDKGMGMGEIKEITELNEQDVIKAKDKMNGNR